MTKLHKQGNCLIGTSGWQYKHWKNIFYPEGLNSKDWLNYYVGQFEAVELNSSFYHQPSKKVFAGWDKAVSDSFIFAVKAPRFFTHLKKLNVSKEQLDTFIDAARGLGKHLGPILFQLPPKWHLDMERLQHFLQLLPNDLQVTIEFRDSSWYRPELYTLLNKNDIAFCIYELGGHQSPIISTASFVYVRLHGPSQKYRGSYSTAKLQSWADDMVKWMQQGKDAYLFFDNDESGYAPQNALQLLRLIGA
ncbi:DUF72 domain-containing protein [Arachidicoccus ginsenosidivorans]|uniref:DUF72 domain-containing protein n=1 Tax=Arachidicoccus ginsenosidivorans TaxID=496057 RepID=A0A5B8VSQ4_9BACT|nr:DUF72 domain-containing protein [Arachidicoccus ginsenosidivorans]QEC73635.1 DUF72 domain-containing protein [Arachidicoccus ginsenosidivorans]